MIKVMLLNAHHESEVKFELFDSLEMICHFKEIEVGRLMLAETCQELFSGETWIGEFQEKLRKFPQTCFANLIYLKN
jgi:hypothetical protein